MIAHFTAVAHHRLIEPSMPSTTGRLPALLAAFAVAVTMNSGPASAAVPGALSATRAVSATSVPADNGSWSQLSTGLDNGVFSIVKGSDDTVYFGGGFSSDNAGQALNNIAAWSPSGQSFSPLGNGVNSSITDMVMSSDDTLYFGGYFTTAVGGPSLARVGAWSAPSRSYSALGPGLSSYVSSLALHDDTLYLSGNFSTYVGGPANQLRKIAQWGPIEGGSSFAPIGSGLNFNAEALHVPTGDDTLYLGGWFSQEEGGVANSLRYVAQWGPLASGGSYAPLGAGVNSLVFTIDSGNDDSVFLGGQFTSSVGGTSLRNIAAWRSGSTSDAGYAPLGLGLSNRVDHIAVDESHELVYAGGLFEYACGDATCAVSDDDTVVLNGVAVFDRRTQAWSPLSEGGGVGVSNPSVSALLIDAESIYVGGFFTATGSGAPLARAARWTWNPPAGSAVVSEAPGSSVIVEGTGLIGVNSVTVGGMAVSIDYSASSDTAVSITLPGGLGPRTHSIVADAVGGLGTIGTYVVGSSAPPPVIPSDPPSGVGAVAGDRLAVVSWSAPGSAGSYPVTHYLVTSSPGSQTCLVVAPALTCEVDGLTNGTPYSFTVKALTGAGWSASSQPSNAVTPRLSAGPSIVIAGAREGKRIAVSGSTTGMRVGGLVTSWTSRGRADWERGREVPVSADGGFTWSRHAAVGPWRVYFTGDGARSNTVTIR